MIKCDDCIFKKGYTTGVDEDPMLTYMEYCYKNHWSGDPQEDAPIKQIDYWNNCEDFKAKTNLENTLN